MVRWPPKREIGLCRFRERYRLATPGLACCPGQPPRLLRLLPLAVMAVVAVVDLLAGPRIGFLPLLSLGPALAAVSYSPSRTALTGGLALGLCVLLALYDERLDSRPGAVALASAAYDAPGLEQIAEQIEISLERQDRDEEFVTAVLAEITLASEAIGSPAITCGYHAR